MKVFSHRLKIIRDSAVRTSRGSSFHHLGARTEKSLKVYLTLILREGGTSGAVLEDLRQRGAVRDVMRSLSLQEEKKRRKTSTETAGKGEVEESGGEVEESGGEVEESGGSGWNVEGQMVVDFAKRMEMAVVNTYFKKKEDHRVTYKSGGRCTQVDYVLCRRCNLKEIGDCKVLVGDSVARQHRMVVCRMVLEVKKKKRRVRTERRIRWWKLKEEECSVRFREEVRQELGGGEEVLDDCGTTAEVMRETDRKRSWSVAQ
ncbi:hypothetical protein C0J50_20287 [Silurus asotus]|uniref:Uncharacterized protein n=1 Tax=Silurus asotus TaxID=30991 RepID=A0AAD5ARE6_SILAS|nr:hypothetical protein C0J50_20287 [Silurus asotus]